MSNYILMIFCGIAIVAVHMIITPGGSVSGRTFSVAVGLFLTMFGLYGLSLAF
jgi:hypothetical protein